MKNLISKVSRLFSDYIANWKKGALILLVMGLFLMMAGVVGALFTGFLVIVFGLKESIDTFVLACILSSPAYVGSCRKYVIDMLSYSTDGKPD